MSLETLPHAWWTSASCRAIAPRALRSILLLRLLLQISEALEAAMNLPHGFYMAGVFLHLLRDCSPFTSGAGAGSSS